MEKLAKFVVLLPVVGLLLGCGSSSTPFSVTPGPAITTTTLASGVVGTSYSQTLTATGGSGTLTWSLTSGSLPAGLTLSSAGVISGTPTASGTSNFTVQVSDSSVTPRTATAPLSITINNPSVTVTTTSLPNGEVGAAYNQSVVAAGGTTPYTWSIASGSLPAGLSLAASTGAITGTPTAAGTSTFTVTVTDSSTPADQSQSRQLIITIVATLTISTTSLPNGTVGIAYNQNLTATGGTGNYAWSVTAGSLPGGIVLSSAGVISGTPATQGNSSFTVQLSDPGPPAQAATQQLSIMINGASGGGLAINTTSLTQGIVGTQYYSSVQASGGNPPYTWSISNGSLPAGLQLNPSTGVISGTPGASGASTFTVTVTDSTTPTALTTSLSLSVKVVSCP